MSIYFFLFMPKILSFGKNEKRIRERNDFQVRDKNDNKKKSSGVGFYVALCCCIAAIGTVGFINTKKAEKNSAPVKPTEKVQVQTVLPTLPPPVQSEAVAAQAPKEVIVTESTPKPTKAPEKKEVDVIENGENEDFYDGDIVESVSIAKQPKFLMPADGEVCCGFSGETLYYDSVMGDFRTHNGIDIAAKSDSDVTAAADGKITEVYEGTLGKTVVLDHANGFKTVYANLDDIENLKEGMELKKGDFIAHVGTYSLGENTTQPHIHFEILRDGEYVNPEDFLD